MKDLLKQLADSIANEEKRKEKSLLTLQNAGILDAYGNFTEEYKNLDHIFKNKNHDKSK